MHGLGESIRQVTSRKKGHQGKEVLARREDTWRVWPGREEDADGTEGRGRMHGGLERAEREKDDTLTGLVCPVRVCKTFLFATSQISKFLSVEPETSLVPQGDQDKQLT